LLNTLQQERGMAIMLITHDLGVVAQMADRVAVMYAGQIIEQAPRKTFFETPQHPYSQKLFAALPDGSRRDEPLAVIPGSVPPLNQIFTGCRFLDRCDRGWSDCKTKLPIWIDAAPDTGVRCHLADAAMLPGEPLKTWDLVNGQNVHPGVAVQSGNSLLEVYDLKVHFPIRKGFFKRIVGYVRAVDGVDVSIPTGETLALVGESGCGKTTVGKGILQLLQPTAGSVRFEDDELTEMRGETLRKRRSDFQIIFQDPFSSMNPRMTVGDIIEEGMVAQRIGEKTSRQLRIEELLAQVGLRPDHIHRYPHEFSGGQRQRICIARALAVAPKLLVCDEPTSALDVSVQAQILNLLKELQQQLGLAYLFVTHDISVVAYLANRVAVMYLGRIVEEGLVAEVLENPRHPYTQALLSAVPTIEADSGRSVIKLEGDIPSPANPPTGCHFHPRCSYAKDICRDQYPPDTALSETHKARCYLLTN
jgi:peptide/nickel transport system ATP-binding protein